MSKPLFASLVPDMALHAFISHSQSVGILAKATPSKTLNTQLPLNSQVAKQIIFHILYLYANPRWDLRRSTGLGTRGTLLDSSLALVLLQSPLLMASLELFTSTGYHSNAGPWPSWPVIAVPSPSSFLLELDIVTSCLAFRFGYGCSHGSEG